MPFISVSLKSSVGVAYFLWDKNNVLFLSISLWNKNNSSHLPPSPPPCACLAIPVYLCVHTLCLGWRLGLVLLGMLLADCPPSSPLTFHSPKHTHSHMQPYVTPLYPTQLEHTDICCYTNSPIGIASPTIPPSLSPQSLLTSEQALHNPSLQVSRSAKPTDSQAYCLEA